MNAEKQLLERQANNERLLIEILRGTKNELSKIEKLKADVNAIRKREQTVIQQLSIAR